MWDHRDRDRANNTRENLRLVTPIINRRNSEMTSLNKSGVRGVCAIRTGWLAYIYVNYKQIRLGMHETLEAATLARLEGERLYWGDEI